MLRVAIVAKSILRGSSAAKTGEANRQAKIDRYRLGIKPRAAPEV